MFKRNVQTNRKGKRMNFADREAKKAEDTKTRITPEKYDDAVGKITQEIIADKEGPYEAKTVLILSGTTFAAMLRKELFGGPTDDEA